MPGASQLVLVVKNLPANAGDTRDSVPSLGREDPLEEGLATHSSILAWETPWTEEPGGLQSSILAWETPWTEEPGALRSIGSQRVRLD